MVALTEEELTAFENKLPTNHIYHLDRGDGTYTLLPKAYYDLTDANTIAWFKANHGVDIDAGDDIVVYEQRAILTVENYGAYKAEARNRIFNSLTKKASNVVMFKRPEPVVIENQDAEGHIVDTDSATLAPVVVEGVGDLAYQWYKIDGEDLIEVEGNETFTAIEPGYYQLFVTRTRNRDIVSNQSIEYRVTNAPEVPVFTADTYAGQINFTVQGLELEREIMSVEWEEVADSDAFFVTWYLERADKEDLEIMTFELSNEEYVSTFNPTKYLDKIEEAGENIEGYYYALVKNKLNGVVSEYNNKPEYKFVVIE